MTRIWKMACVLAPLGFAAGCATMKRGAPEIKEEWVARVPESEMGPINDAREAVRTRKDDFTRAEVALKDTQRELDVQKGLHASEKTRVKALEKALEAAKSTGDSAEIQKAEQRVSEGNSAAELAKERVDVAQGRVDVAQLERDLADVAVKRASTDLQSVEFDKLRALGDTRVEKISPASFEAELARLSAREDELQNKLSDRSRSLAFAERRLRDLEQRQGVGGAGKTPSPPAAPERTPEDLDVHPQ